MNLIAGFLETAERRQDAIALVEGSGRRIGFAGLEARSAAFARAWRLLGLTPGDRVLIAMPVGIDLYAAIAACWRIGAVVVFPEPAMGLGGLSHAVALAKPRALLCAGAYSLLPLIAPPLRSIPLRLRAEADGSPPLDEPVAELGPDHPALISFTSGSTGAPKGIVRSHGFLAAQNSCVAEMLRPERETEIDLVAFPVFVIANLGLGICSVLPDWPIRRPDRARAHALSKLIKREGVGRALLPPSICETLAGAAADPGLTAIFTGGGPVFPDLMRDLTAAMPRTTLTAVYGSTEAEPITHVQAAEIADVDWRAMAAGEGLLAGAPIGRIAVRIVEDEILVTGDHVNKSYLGGRGDDENKRLLDGQVWHRTGDAGRLDASGRLWLRGRMSGRAGGLYPFEVEVAARSWPGVRRAALMPGSARQVLAIEGREPAPGGWRAAAAELGEISVRKVKRVPLDSRHRSKVDYVRLAKMMGRRG